MKSRVETEQSLDPETLKAIEEERMSPSWIEFEGVTRGVFIDDETAPGAGLPPTTSQNPRNPYQDAPFLN